MNLICESLASFTLAHYILCLLQSARPVKPIPECLCHYGSGRGVMATLSLMDISEDLFSFFWLDTALEHGGHASLV